MSRFDGRAVDQLRPVSITPNFLQHATGSCLITFGKTRVICAAMVEESVPPFLKGSGKGWLTAEYSMMPASSSQRVPRERQKVGGRTHEIQRLIGRSLRAAIDLPKLGERSILVDCDVVDADGGTRTAAITGAFVAVSLAVRKLRQINPAFPELIRTPVAAISVGMVKGVACLDLPYEEDKEAEVDMNVVRTGEGKYVEVQGTGEGATFGRSELDAMLKLADKGIDELFAAQRRVLESV